jgi:hypothetical protein
VLGVVRATTDVDALLFVALARLAQLGTLFKQPLPGALTLGKIWGQISIF